MVTEKAEETKLVVENPNPEEGVSVKGLSVTSAGYSYIYDTKTGDRSKTNNNMLPMQLKKKHPDGTPRFTTIKPPFEPKKGTLKCMLHADDPNRKLYDEMGLPSCKKHNLTNPFQVRRHMEKRHKMEWQAIEQMRIEKERQEDREFQRKILSRGIEEEDKAAPLYVSDKPEKKKTKP